jgi:membrane fusion protein, heavy metal efflux system
VSERMTKSTLLNFLGGLAVVALGFFSVVLAEHQGWLGGGATAGLQACPHTLSAEACPFCTPRRVEESSPCPEHGVPEALCSRCDATLIPAFKALGDWCGGHDVPESQCVICDPSRAPVGSGPAPSEIQLVAREDLPRSARPPSAQCSTETLRVQFLSAQIARDAGLRFAQVTEREVPATLTCTAEVEYDQNRYAHVSARAAGVLSLVAGDLGQRVRKGDRLALVTSGELGAAKAELLQSRSLADLWERNYARELRLAKKHVSTERELLRVQTELAKSRVAFSGASQRLRNLGLSDAQIAAVCSSLDTSASLVVVAPFAGTVVARDAVVGEVVKTDKSLFGLADTRAMWAMLDLQSADVRRVRSGQSVVLSITGLPGEAFPGEITWVSAEVDRRTRTVRARAEVANPEGVLRAGMFGEAQVQLHAPRPRVLVPKSAIQWEGCCNVVFLRKSDRLFEPRKVRLGDEAGLNRVVEEGLAPGDTVVTTGSFLLKTEILKGSIGAGCCEAGQ